jgi:class 3 adenylate cyclase
MKGELERALEAAEQLAVRAAERGIGVWGQFLGAFASTPSLHCLGRHEALEATLPFWRMLPQGETAAAYWMAASRPRDETRRELHRLISLLKIGDADEWVEDSSFFYLLGTATAIGDVEATSLLYPRVLGNEERYFYATGSLPLVMGQAAEILHDIPAARGHFEEALATASKVGDRVEAARAHLALARVFFEHFPEERAASGEHLKIATQEFQAMKMQPALEDAMRLKLRFQGITSGEINTSIESVAQIVQKEQPDLRPHAAPDGTVTIMFSDIEGSTEKTDRLGDKRWMEVLREHNAIVREQIKAHNGFEVKSEGDGFMVAFQSARKAIECAVGIQRALAERNRGVGAQHQDSSIERGTGREGGEAGGRASSPGAAPPQASDPGATAEPIRVRIGLHAGEVIKEGEDFFGRNVIMAARVASQARGGEILASSVLKALVEGSDVAWGEKRTVELKGLPGEHEIWVVQPS